MSSPISIAPDSSLSREIAAGAKEEFLITLDQQQLLSFSIDKGDLLLSITVYDPKNQKLLELASQEFEIIEASFPTEESGTYRIEITSREKKTPRRYDLRVYPLTQVTALSRKNTEPQQALGRAEVLRTDWTEASLRASKQEFDHAAAVWTANGDFAKASSAQLKSGDLCFSLSEYTEAASRYQAAAALGAKARDRFREAKALSQIGLVQSYLGNNHRAQTHLNNALSLLGNCEANSGVVRNACATALSNLAEVSYATGDLIDSTLEFQRVAKLFADDRKGRAKVHLFVGNIAGTLGERTKAKAEISQALELFDEINNRASKGLALIALGLTHSSQVDEDRSFKLYREAEQIFRTIGDRHSEAIALNASGQAYENLHDYSTALRSYESALQLFHQVEALDLASVTITKVAKMHYLLKNLDEALANYKSALKMSRDAGKTRSEANALTEIAQVYDEQGHHQQALDLYQKVQAFYRSINDLQGQALALNSEGDVLLRVGKTALALEIYGKALSLSQRVEDKGIVISTLFDLARAHQRASNLDVALSFVQRSIKDIEDLRSNVGRPDLRTSYFSGVQQHYKLCIDILMELDEARPGQGFVEQAFLVSDKSRARLLVDLLIESRVHLHEGATADLLARERALRGMIAAQAQYHWTLTKANSSEAAVVGAELAKNKAEYEEVQSQLRNDNPHLDSLERSAPLSVSQIQQELRDENTLLLHFALGEKRSYLWAVTSNSFQSYRLPAGKVLEDAATEVYKLATARQTFEGNAGSDYQSEVARSDQLFNEKASGLSQMLFGPVADQLGNKRLLLVTEGKLQLLPFDALPVPLAKPGATESASVGPTLLENNEIVQAASMSTLVAIRNARTAMHSPGKVVAVIADPVFGRHDNRMPNAQISPIAFRNASDQGSQGSAARPPNNTLRGGFARLTHASVEADAIAAAAPHGSSFVAKGFEASRETAMSPQIGEYQIVHFATHGVLDSQRPELSAIVLSTVDSDGVDRNGLMPLPDIYSLNLSAELTVLSACQTALGKDVKGEGFVGLTHSFMAAGSNSVVASLWKVDDRATAALMAHLYESMLQSGMTPSAALRAAKLEIKRQKQWSAPYYWAGFVLHGEYTNRIAVENHTWVSSGWLIFTLVVLTAAGLIVLRKRQRWLVSADKG